MLAVQIHHPCIVYPDLVKTKNSNKYVSYAASSKSATLHCLESLPDLGVAIRKSITWKKQTRCTLHQPVPATPAAHFRQCFLLSPVFRRRSRLLMCCHVDTVTLSACTRMQVSNTGSCSGSCCLLRHLVPSQPRPVPPCGPAKYHTFSAKLTTTGAPP